MTKFSLLKSTTTIKKADIENFDILDLFCGVNAHYEVLKTGGEVSAQNLFENLKNLKCTFTSHFNEYDVEAYAIEVFEEAENGEF